MAFCCLFGCFLAIAQKMNHKDTKAQRCIFISLINLHIKIESFVSLCLCGFKFESRCPHKTARSLSEVSFEPYDEDIGRASELAIFCSFVQLDKAIPLMLKMNERSSSSDNKLGSIDYKFGSMNEKMESLAENMDLLAENMGSMAENQKETLRGLREDLVGVGNREWQRRIERDISVIKSKLQIR